MKKTILISSLLLVSAASVSSAQTPEAVIWKKYELTFTSLVSYENPVQDVRSFRVTFTSPTGTSKTINGFWDGSNTWKARFMPDETGKWNWISSCSDKKNTGLDNIKGEFICPPACKAGYQLRA